MHVTSSFARLLAASAVLLALSAVACGRDAAGVYSPAPTAPTPPRTAASALTIRIAEINGPYSFYPSPAAIQPGQAVIWSNGDFTTHHLVFDDGSVDTGTLAPGTVSQPQTIAGRGSYHCTIHPSMVGTIDIVSTSDR
jgi:plastocyanin